MICHGRRFFFFRNTSTVERVNFTATSSRESYTPYNSNKHGKVVDYWKMSDGFLSELQCLRCFIRVHKAHRIHVWYIYLHFYHKNQPNVGKYTIHGSYGKNKIDATLVWNSHVPCMFRERFVKQPLRTHGWRPTSLANDWPWLFASWFRAGCPRNLRYIFLWFVVECWCAKPPWIDRKSLLGMKLTKAQNWMKLYTIIIYIPLMLICIYIYICIHLSWARWYRDDVFLLHGSQCCPLWWDCTWTIRREKSCTDDSSKRILVICWHLHVGV